MGTLFLIPKRLAVPLVTSVTILLNEENHGDVILFQTVLEGHTANIALRVARHVDTGICLLTCAGIAGNSLRPIVILLDLHMPGKDGMSFLQYWSESAELTHIPVIVLSSSTRQKDADDCMRLGALRYRTKPLNWPGYQTLITELRPFWERKIQNA